MDDLFTIHKLNNPLLKITKIFKTPEELEEDNKRINNLKYLLNVKKSEKEMKEIVKKMETYTTTEIDIKTVNDSWKKTPKYIPENFDEIEQQLKYLRSRTNLFNGSVVSPPEIYKNNDNEFVNGRNRFANLRDLKCKKMFFQISN
jgi:hypothetical protein